MTFLFSGNPTMIMRDKVLPANLYHADLYQAHVRDEQLAEAYGLFGATMPNHERYDGRFNLKGDLEEARRKGIDINDPDMMQRWYDGDINVLLRGLPIKPDWYEDLEADERDMDDFEVDELKLFDLDPEEFEDSGLEDIFEENRKDKP